MKFKVFSKY